MPKPLVWFLWVVDRIVAAAVGAACTGALASLFFDTLVRPTGHTSLVAYVVMLLFGALFFAACALILGVIPAVSVCDVVGA